MPKNGEKDSSFKAGMYLLETLTSGLYNEPLSIYREYIQNSVDSIDLMDCSRLNSLDINIDLDPINRQITISDNGMGIPAHSAEKILSSIGSSNKLGSKLRGFRGIGRLGGIAFSDKATYRTKALGENVESVQEWDCKELRKILLKNKKNSMNLKQIFEHTTVFSQNNNKLKNDSYFKVTLEGVSSFKNSIFDIEKIRDYLSQVAPVSFNNKDFSFADEIDEYLSKNLNHYGKYTIKINGDQIYKYYRDSVKVTKKGFDYIENIKFFKIKIKRDSMAYGWYGERKELLGAISKAENSSGIRVRLGNILIGDAHLLDKCFRETRFNSYMIGEIHINCSDLIPNSRRDDFIDNEAKTLFYNAIEQKIGLPISKEIRLRSRINSKPIKPNEPIIPNNPSTIKNQNSNLIQNYSFKHENNTKKVNQFNVEHGNGQVYKAFYELLESCKGCPNLSKILSKYQPENEKSNIRENYVIPLDSN